MDIKTIVIEDNLMEATVLEQFCSNYEVLNLSNKFSQGKEALSYLKNNQVDLMFLDIEMPDMTGLELLDQLSYFPQIIITTANKDYAYNAFEYEVVDFLVKPIPLPRFQKTIEKVISNHEMRNKVALSSASTELYVKTDGKYIRVPYSDILYFENVGDYIKVITNNGMHIIYGALKALAERLSYPRFLKVHRSFIVNLDKIVDIEDNTLVIGKKVIPISRAHKPIIMNSINII